MLSGSQIAAPAIATIKAAELSFEVAIGTGSFGEVWKGKWRNAEVAIKQVRADAISEKCMAER
jgi:predicted Ser/Thr protein kinase